MIEQLWLLAVNYNANDLGIPNTKANSGVLNSVIDSVFIAVGAIALLFLLFGAGRYIISRGEDGEIQKAKDTMVYSLLGLVLAVSAFLIVEFISNRIA